MLACIEREGRGANKKEATQQIKIPRRYFSPLVQPHPRALEFRWKGDMLSTSQLEAEGSGERKYTFYISEPRLIPLG